MSARRARGRFRGHRRARTLPGGEARGRRAAAPAGSRGPESGQASIEFLGFLPILLVIALAVIQLGLAAYAAQQAGTAARAAARTATLDERDTSPAAAGQAAMSGWLADGARIDVSQCPGEARATAHVDIPSVVPGIDFGTANRSATMPCPADD